MRDALNALLVAAGLVGPLAAAADATPPPAPTQAPAPSEDEQIVDWAAEILQEVARLPADQRAQFAALVGDAHAFAIFPRVSKRGIVFARIEGRGVLVARDGDGRWGLPVLLRLQGSSVGPQAGAVSSDVLVVFRTRAALETIGTQARSGADIAPGGNAAEGDIVSYHTRRGLVLGQSIDRTALFLDDAGNASLYGPDAATGPIGVSTRAGIRPPPCAQKLMEQANILAGQPPAAMKWR
jgi:lipid-binding SYLF domain-containing protein